MSTADGWSTTTEQPRALQQLLWVTACLLLAAAPHLTSVPVWVALFTGSSALWRLTVETRRWRLPPTWLRSLIAIGAMLGVFATYRTLNGLEAGSAFLLVMGGMKLLETHNRRDLTVVVFVAFFLLFATFLYNQTLLRLPYMLLAVWLFITTLMRISQHAPMSVREAVGWTGRMDGLAACCCKRCQSHCCCSCSFHACRDSSGPCRHAPAPARAWMTRCRPEMSPSSASLKRSRFVSSSLPSRHRRHNVTGAARCCMSSTVAPGALLKTAT
jgi:hypothetical protein